MDGQFIGNVCYFYVELQRIMEREKGIYLNGIAVAAELGYKHHGKGNCVGKGWESIGNRL